MTAEPLPEEPSLLTRLGVWYGSLSRLAQYGLIVLPALLLLTQLLDLSARVDELKEERTALERQLGEYGDGLDLERWQARQVETQAAMADWQSLRWQGDTPGIIQSQIRATLENIGQRALLESQSTNIDPNPIDLPTGPALRVTMNGASSDGVDVVKALGDLAGLRPVLQITDLNINIAEDQSARFRLQALAPITTTRPESDKTGDPL